jgi:hypothetical protein
MTTPERAGGWVQPKAPGANAVKVATTNESRTDGPCGGVRAESRQRKAAQGAIRATLPQRLPFCLRHPPTERSQP